MIDLPLRPGSVSLEWRRVDYGGRQTPALGGAISRVNRLGSRLAVSVSLPPMMPDVGRAWVAALDAAVELGARWRIRQPGLVIGTPGTPVVDGAGQAGRSLSIRAAQPHYVFRAQQLVTIGGRLAMLASGVMVAADGTASLPLTAPLRAEPVDGEPVDVAGPTIEGLLEGDGLSWTVDRARRYGLGFAITEAR